MQTRQLHHIVKKWGWTWGRLRRRSLEEEPDLDAEFMPVPVSSFFSDIVPPFASFTGIEPDRTELTASSLRNLRFPHLLLCLDLSSNNFGDEGARVLTLPPRLQFLNLNLNNIGDEGARDLVLPGDLRVLRLYCNQITAAGAASLRLPPCLEVLDLYANHLGPDGTEHIKFPLTLQTLNLKNNLLGDTGAGNLRLPPNLKALHLGFNRSAGCAALRLPKRTGKVEHGGNAPGNGVPHTISSPVLYLTSAATTL